MSRKKKHEHVNHERWLVSYADFITLLFAFFVVLFASSQADKHKQKQLASAIQSAFTQGIFEAHSPTPALGESTAASSASNAEPKPIALPLDTAAVVAHVKQAMRGHPNVTVQPTMEGVVVSLHEAGFFDSGSAALRGDALTTLDALAAALPASALRVEGHTDNLPIRSTLYASNWELSSARASAIARFLIEHGQRDPAQLAVAGYAEFHPAATNDTAEGRAQNRRVDIVVLHHGS